jgi:uncharacterized membrane protein YqhA
MRKVPSLKSNPQTMNLLAKVIFSSRWLQLPLYLGLIAAQAVYVYHFWVELVHLLEAAFGSQTALQALVNSMAYKADAPVTALNETIIMLVVLALIDVVMISNLLIMVIMGGYDTFVSRMNVQGHPDEPEWLDHVNAQDLHQRRQLHRQGADCPDCDPHHLPVLGHGHRLHRSADDPSRQSTALIPFIQARKDHHDHHTPSRSHRIRCCSPAVHQLLKLTQN